MPNVSIIWDTSNSFGDFVVGQNGLQPGGMLQSAVLVSLFTDRRARPDDRIGADDPRGWWGDSYAAQPIGCRLWLLLRSKRTTETLRRAKDYILESLQWLLDDGVAARVDVLTEWTRPGLLGAQITISQRDGTTLALAYDFAWEA